ncbi:MAG: hypothetical protein U1E33_06085 [Rhodospirillales bacterium]
MPTSWPAAVIDASAAAFSGRSASVPTMKKVIFSPRSAKKPSARGTITSR